MGNPTMPPLTPSARGANNEAPPYISATLQRLDPASLSKDDARASALSAGTMHLLQALGVWPALEAKAQPFISIMLIRFVLRVMNPFQRQN